MFMFYKVPNSKHAKTGYKYQHMLLQQPWCAFCLQFLFIKYEWILLVSMLFDTEELAPLEPVHWSDGLARGPTSVRISPWDNCSYDRVRRRMFDIEEYFEQMSKPNPYYLYLKETHVDIFRVYILSHTSDIISSVKECTLTDIITD